MPTYTNNNAKRNHKARWEDDVENDTRKKLLTGKKYCRIGGHEGE